MRPGWGDRDRQGQSSVTATPVTVLVNGQELPIAFAGLTPDIAGLYQVNVAIPTGNIPPGLGQSLSVKQGAVSNVVPVAIQ